MKVKLRMIALFFVICICAYLYFSRDYYQMIKCLFGTLGDAIVMLAAICGVFGICIQLRNDAKLKEAEFLYNFNTEYINNASFSTVFNYCANEAGIFSKRMEEVALPTQEDIVKYLDFFEPVYYLVNNRIISIEKLSDLLEHRFLVVVCNEYIQEQAIKPTPAYYKTLYSLFCEFKKCVQKKNKGGDYNKLILLIEANSLDKIFSDKSKRSKWRKKR